MAKKIIPAPMASSVAIDRMSALGVRVDVAASLTDYIRRLPIGSRIGTGSFITTFVNPFSAIRIRSDEKLSRLLERFDMVLPDGIGMCMAVERLLRRRPARASFDNTSIAPIVFAAACRYGSTVALVGGGPGIARRAAERLRGIYTGIRIVATYDGFDEYDLALTSPDVLGADIVVCGMGTGIQEKFLVELQERGWTGCGFTCGGYLDQLTVRFKYYPDWIDTMQLRWAYRLFREPRRLWRRYLIDYPHFALLVAAAVCEMYIMERRRAVPAAAIPAGRDRAGRPRRDI